MEIPSHNIPTRKEWRKLRDKAGGKSGMSKANLGPALDRFHKAFAKAEKKGEPAEVVKVLNDLSSEAKTYVAEVSRKDKKVGDAANKAIKGPVDKYVGKLAATVQAQHKDLNKQSAILETTITLVERGRKSIVAAAAKHDKVLDPLEAKYRREVPDSVKGKLGQALDKLRKPVMATFEASQTLKREMESQLGKVDPAIKDSYKKQISKMHDEVREAMLAANRTVGVLADLSAKVK